MDVNDILKNMQNISYGHIDDFDSFSEEYILQSPKEVEKNKVGVCWDQVELERYYIGKYFPTKTFFIVYFDGDKCPTHTFLVFKRENSYYWVENSWEIFRAIHKYDSINELLVDVKNKFIQYELNNDCDIENIFLYEYDEPKYHLNVQDYFEHCTSGKLIK